MHPSLPAELRKAPLDPVVVNLLPPPSLPVLVFRWSQGCFLGCPTLGCQLRIQLPPPSFLPLLCHLLVEYCWSQGSFLGCPTRRYQHHIQLPPLCLLLLCHLLVEYCWPQGNFLGFPT